MTPDQKFLGLALHVSTWSPDPSSKVGCIITHEDRVLVMASNAIPLAVDPTISARHERPTKYLYYEHAERHACYLAARDGITLKGTTLYLTSTPIPFLPCADCARAIILSGIVRLVQPDDVVTPPRWKESCRAATAMLREAGVALDRVQL